MIKIIQTEQGRACQAVDQTSIIFVSVQHSAQFWLKIDPEIEHTHFSFKRM